MTREEFKKILDDKGYSYREEGDKIVITHIEDVWLGYANITTIPPGVKFQNGGYVSLNFVEILPSNTLFDNYGYVALDSLKNILPGVEFENRGHIWIESIIKDPWASWKGNIKGIDYKKLLNKMISLGLFDKEKK